MIPLTESIPLPRQTELKIQVIPGDGHCLFGSLLHQLLGIRPEDANYQVSIGALRRLVVFHIKRNLTRFSAYFDTQRSSSLDRILRDLEQGNAWGGQECIVAVSELFEIRVNVVSPYTMVNFGNNSRTCWIYYHQAGNYTGSDEIFNHYDSILEAVDTDQEISAPSDIPLFKWRTEVKQIPRNYTEGCNSLFFREVGQASVMAFCHQLRGHDRTAILLQAKILTQECLEFYEANAAAVDRLRCPPIIFAGKAEVWKLLVCAVNVSGKRASIIDLEGKLIVSIAPFTPCIGLNQSLLLCYDGAEKEVGSVFIRSGRPALSSWDRDDIVGDRTPDGLICGYEPDSSEGFEDTAMPTFASWNVRGCCRDEKRTAIDEVLMENNITVALLQEVNIDCVSLVTTNYKWMVFKTPNNKQRTVGEMEPKIGLN